MPMAPIAREEKSLTPEVTSFDSDDHHLPETLPGESRILAVGLNEKQAHRNRRGPGKVIGLAVGLVAPSRFFLWNTTLSQILT